MRGRKVVCTRPIFPLAVSVTDLLEGSVDENGMIDDVVVLELSDDDSEDKPKAGIKIMKNKNPTADIEEFWEPVPHRKGDATARHRCLCCK